MNQVINAIITEENGAFVAANPDTGVTSQGDTIEGALANLKEAVELYLEEAGHSISFGKPAFLTTITL